MLTFASILDLYVKSWPLEVHSNRLYELGVVDDILDTLDRKKKSISNKTRSTLNITQTQSTLNSTQTSKLPPLIPKITRLPVAVAAALPAASADAPGSARGMQSVSQEPRKRASKRKHAKCSEHKTGSPLTSAESDWERYCAYAARHNGNVRKPSWLKEVGAKFEERGCTEALPMIEDVMRDLTTQRKELHRVTEDLKRILISEGSIDVEAKFKTNQRARMLSFTGQMSDRLQRSGGKVDVLDFFADVDLNLESTLVRDLAKNLKVSLARVAEVEQSFEKIAGPCRLLNIHSFERLMDKLLGFKISPSQLASSWKAADCQNVGLVSFRDFAASFFRATT
jgi:hypothetical protein